MPSPQRQLFRFGPELALRHGGLIVAVCLWVHIVMVAELIDARAYWRADGISPYAVPAGTEWSFHYSPVVAQLFSLFGGLPFQVFAGLWTALLIAIVLWLIPPTWWIPALVLSYVELAVGNVHLIIALATVLAFRQSAGWWAVPLLLKVTPALGALWYVFKRDWRRLIVAGGVTLLVVLPSFAIAPGLWPEWVAYLHEASGRSLGGPQIPIPIWPRLAAAIVVVAFAAKTERVWLVPVAVVLALPSLWPTGFLILFAMPRLRAGRYARPAQGGAPDGSMGTESAQAAAAASS